MNPWALVVIALGILLIIIGAKGTQHNIAGAITGNNKSNQSSTTAKTSISKAGAGGMLA